MLNTSLLSKLMAREDLEVIEGNFRTASFDPTNRILRLPLLKEEHKDAATLFIGHEVGHALYTPSIFSHDESINKLLPDIEDIPHSILNIVEDVRIERLVREFYPGLINDFLKGYRHLVADNFFGIKDVDVDTLGFLDRLNLKAKLSKTIDIKFSFKESVMMSKVFQIDTWDDTVRVSRELMEFLDEQQEQQQQQQQQSSDGSGDSEESEESEDSSGLSESLNSDVGDTEASEDGDDSLESGSSDTDANANDTDDNSVEEDNVSSSSGGGLSDTGDTTGEDPYHSVTDDAFRKNENKMINEGSGTSYLKFTKEQLVNEFLYTDEEVERSYTEFLEMKNNQPAMQIYHDEFINVRYKEFIRDVKPAVNAMVQQFELRKSAMESRKARQSTSGSIDVDKLWQYKLDDHIFKSIMSFPDAKNHGLLMYVDFSSSMWGRLYETVKQSVILIMFAKRVGIPYELYTFTTNGKKWKDNGKRNMFGKGEDYGKYDLANYALGMIKIADSSWTTSKQNKMTQRVMFSSETLTGGNAWMKEKLFSMGGTPLIETAAYSLILADDFVKKHNTEKMNVVFLTDGQAQDIRTKSLGYGDQKVVVFDVEGYGRLEANVGGIYSYYSRTKLYQKAMFDALRKRYNVIGFFLTSYRKLVNPKVGYIVHDKIDSDNEFYDRYIVVHDKRLQAEDDEFVTVADDDPLFTTDRKRMNTIKRDFKKFQKNKKSNKLIAQEFARMVA